MYMNDTLLYVWPDSYKGINAVGNRRAMMVNFFSRKCVTWLIFMYYIYQHSWRPKGSGGPFFRRSGCTSGSGGSAVVNVWHDSFICVTWLLHKCVMTPSYLRHDSFIHVQWLLHMSVYFFDAAVAHAAVVTRQWWQRCSTWVTWLIHMCYMTPSYVRHDFFICKMTPSYECVHFFDAAVAQAVVVATLQYMSHELIHMCVKSFVCEIWLIHTCDMTPSYENVHFSDSALAQAMVVAVLQYICDMTHLYVRHNLFCMWDMTPSCVWHDSLMWVCVFFRRSSCTAAWRYMCDMTKENYSCPKETYKRDWHKKPTKTTYKRDMFFWHFCIDRHRSLL